MRVVSVCPSECHQIACATGVLSCPDGGLYEIPRFLPPGTTKIILTNHKLRDVHLQYSNLSNYGPPQFKVDKIAIQNCSLTTISPSTFSHLTDLSTLDLAKNKLIKIMPDTFSSLTLNFLRLDGNRNIILNSHSFRGLIVSTLSLIDCSIRHILFETINEIAGSLKKLFLTNNKITTIDRLFKNIFEHLTVLQINDNPINCTCDLQWLSSVLQFRKKQQLTTDTPGVNSEPQCQSPPNHYGKQLVNLIPKDFNCHLPQLRLIDVYMTSNVSARLTCTSEAEPNDSPNVQWLSKVNNKLIFESQAKESAAFSVFSRGKVDNFMCVISNVNGNVTVLVKIQWPGHARNVSYPSQSNRGDSDSSKSSDNSSSTDPYIYSKRFTLLEMIGGVVGTFTLAMVLFLCIYRYMVVSLRRERKKKWYIAYEPAGGSDSQTYDVPNCPGGPYYTGQLFSNHNSPLRYPTEINGHFSPIKTAVL